MGAAFGWGAIAASSLIIGALLAFWVNQPARDRADHGVRRRRADRAAAFDLVEEATEMAAGSAGPRWGMFAGCFVFFGGDWLIGRLGGGDRKERAASRDRVAAGDRAGHRARRNSGVEVIGLTIYQGGEVGFAYLAAVFLSNLPESVSSTTGWSRGAGRGHGALDVGRDRRRVGARLAGRLRLVSGCPARHHRLRLGVRGGRDSHDAGGHHDARGIRARREARRRRDHPRLRLGLRHPHTELRQPKGLDMGLRRNRRGGDDDALRTR